jgi:RsiW-degrading membrane proteinase PrsW (M82 family)
MNGDWELTTSNQQAEEGRSTHESEPSSSPISQPLGLASAFLGLALAIAACACGPLTALASGLGSRGAAIQRALAVTVLGGGLGLALAAVGWSLWQGRPSRRFYPVRGWPLWAALLALLAVGALISSLGLGAPYLLPLINTLTMMLLPALIVAAVGRALGGRGGSWRDVVGGLIGGGSLGAGLAVIVELSLVALTVAGALVLGLIPGGMDTVRSLVEQVRDPTFLSDPQALLDLLTPGTALIALILVGVIAPLVEETTKTLGVALLGLRLKPAPARAFLMGVASGAGFALAENLLNSAVISSLWVPGVLSRLAATLLHCATGGLTGWGWGELWGKRRPRRLLLAFAGALGLHGAWNSVTLGMVVSGLVSANQLVDSPSAMLGSSVALVLGAALLLLLGVTLVGLWWASRRLARGEREA